MVLTAVIIIAKSTILELFEKFFGAIKNEFNQSQLESIKTICLSAEGINLLQGPVTRDRNIMILFCSL